MKRKTCPVHCPCICHDTGGGHYGEHPVQPDGSTPCLGKVHNGGTGS